MQTLIKSSVFIFLLGGLLACASNPLPISPSKTRFIFSAHRQLELEPCGCTILNYGGIDREANGLSRFRKEKGDFFYLAAGSTFVPEAPPKAFQSDFYRLKRDEVVQALSTLGVQVLAPSAEDASLGKAELLRLASQARFSFVSANLVDTQGKLLFPSHTWLRKGADSILVIGLSGTTSSRFEMQEGLRLLENVQALKRVFSSVTEPAGTVVLLHSMSDSERRQIHEAFPQIHLIFGGRPEESTSHSAAPYSASTLAMTTISRGRGISWIELDAKPVSRFFNQAVAESSVQYRGILESRKASLDALPHLGEREQQERKSIEGELDAIAKMEIVPSSTSTFYQFGSFPITSDMEAPPNALTERLNAFKARTRELALSTGQ